MSHRPRLVEVVALSGYRLRLRFDDGTQGEVDLSEDIGMGVMTSLRDEAAFSRVRVGPQGQVAWTNDIDICPVALYLEISGKPVEELFTAMKAEAVA